MEQIRYHMPVLRVANGMHGRGFNFAGCAALKNHREFFRFDKPYRFIGFCTHYRTGILDDFMDCNIALKSN